MPLYDMPLFRPPSEADSLILQVTLGCSHNQCAFCSMYRTKRFRVVPVDEVARDLEQAARLEPSPRRVFLADGDAMCLSASRLCELLDLIHGKFPRLQRVGIYANARDVLSKTDDQLAELRSRKLRMVYVGLESGDSETLSRVGKGATCEEIELAVRRVQAAGMSASVMVLIGLAGVERSLEHARASAEAINRMAPSFTALLTYTPTPGSPLGEAVGRGEFVIPGPVDSVREIRAFVESVTCRTYFTCNHASNYLPLVGTLPEVRERMLATLDAALAGQISLKPEFLRGL